MHFLRWTLLIVAAANTGCSGFPHYRNPDVADNSPPITKATPLSSRYDFTSWLGSQAVGELPPNAVIVTFSGGGTRAATLAYEVARRLESVTATSKQVSSCKGTQTCPRNLAQAVIMISGISGGSFTAAPMALGTIEGEPGLDVVKAKVLHARLVPVGIKAFLYPQYWFDRSLSLSDWADGFLKGATFKTLMQDHRRPFLFISGADVLSGQSIPYTQEWMSDMCSDVSLIKIADAVGNASDLPYLFGDVELKNHRSTRTDCDKRFPSLAELNDGQPFDTVTKVENRYRAEMRYESFVPEERRIEVLHLNDGGLSDNLGVRPVIRELTRPGIMEELKTKGVQNLMILVVNARSEPTNIRYQKSGASWWPSLVTGLPFHVVDDVTSLSATALHDHLNSFMAYKCSEDILGECSKRYPSLYLSSVDFDSLECSLDDRTTSPEQCEIWDQWREDVKNISTKLSLSDLEISNIRKVAMALLDHDSCFEKFVSNTGFTEPSHADHSVGECVPLIAGKLSSTFPQIQHFEPLQVPDLIEAISPDPFVVPEKISVPK